MPGTGLFASWFAEQSPPPPRAIDAIVFFKEMADHRQAVWPALLQTIRSHYLSDEKLAEFCDLLGYDDTATALRAFLPSEKTSRSGDLGEILATEYVNERLPFSVPIKRLRYKDERNTALRGDDLIGLRLEAGALHVLKGEAKSRKSLSTAVLMEAEIKLRMNAGLPSSHTATFLAARSNDKDLARALLRLTLRQAPPRSLRHLIFSLTQSKPANIIPRFAARSYPAEIQRLFITAIINEHGETVARAYEECATADELRT